MRLIPIALVLLSSFALVTAVPMDRKKSLSRAIVNHKVQLSNCRGWQKSPEQRTSEDAVMIHHFQSHIDAGKQVLNSLALQDAQNRFNITFPPAGSSEAEARDHHMRQLEFYRKAHDDARKQISFTRHSAETFYQHSGRALYTQMVADQKAEMAVAEGHIHTLANILNVPPNLPPPLPSSPNLVPSDGRQSQIYQKILLDYQSGKAPGAETGDRIKTRKPPTKPPATLPPARDIKPRAPPLPPLSEVAPFSPPSGAGVYQPPSGAGVYQPPSQYLAQPDPRLQQYPATGYPTHQGQQPYPAPPQTAPHLGQERSYPFPPMQGVYTAPPAPPGQQQAYTPTAFYPGQQQGQQPPYPGQSYPYPGYAAPLGQQPYPLPQPGQQPYPLPQPGRQPYPPPQPGQQEQEQSGRRRRDREDDMKDGTASIQLPDAGQGRKKKKK